MDAIPSRGAYRAHIAASGWTLLLLAALLMPGGQPGDSRFDLPEGADKAGHFCLFLVETLLLGRSFLYSLPRRSPLLWAVAAGIVLALLTEIAQLWVPWRSYESADILADLAGVGLGAGILRFRRGTRSET